MNPAKFLMAGLLAAAVAGCSGGLAQNSSPQNSESAGPTQPPNVVFILADDLGYGDLGCYGQKQIQTPNIDALAKNGMKFTDAYAGDTVCAPSRCALLTGLTSGHGRIRGNLKVDLRPEDTTVTQSLHDAGYYVFSIGKWSMGAVGSSGDPTHKDVDYFFGFVDQTHAHNSYPTFLYRNEQKITLPNVVPHEGKYGQGVATVKKVYVGDLFDQESLAFLQKQHPGGQPFFMYLAYTAPHANGEAHENEVPSLGIYQDKDWPLPEKQYAALVGRLDDSVGKVMTALHNAGVSRNTLVIFASDNGVQEEGNTKAAFFDSSGPFRGVKRDMYEGGIRVPFIVDWPGHIQPKTVSHLPIAFWDFFATMGDLTGCKVPANTDGISFLPELLGHHARQKEHEFLYWEFHERGFEQAVRYNAPDGTAWKAVKHSFTGPMELYDLNTDIGETKNIAADHPDIVAKITDYLKTARTDSKEFPITPASRRGGGTD
ncbi:MAG TPA: arylsulfatase [Phycisphaerae bacterium]|nr:arylsulfatase [Phycisphaerae bacterium]